MIGTFKLFLFILTFLFLRLSFAVAPGDPCTAPQANHVTTVSGPDVAGDYHLLKCNGSIWQQFLSIKGNQNVGIGTDSPATKLDVAGGIKVGSATLTCNGAASGALRYNTTEQCIEACNGTFWRCLQTTVCASNLPNIFSFTNAINQDTSTEVVSGVRQITGIDDCSVEVSVSGDSSARYRVCADSSCSTPVQDWTASKTSLTNNQYVQLKLTSSAFGGVIRNSTITVGARSVGWSVTTLGDCSSAEPPVGTRCADSTIYIGITPDGANKIFTSPCDPGRIPSGTICTGTAVITMPWSNNNTINNGLTNPTTGQANSAALAALSNTDSPYYAAQYCENLTYLGHSDWYLPSSNEAQVIRSACDGIPDFSCGNNNATSYWTSTESSTTEAIRYRGVTPPSTGTKTVSLIPRCVRKE